MARDALFGGLARRNVYNPRMSGISRYLLGQLVATMLFAAAALTGVVWLSQSLRYIDLIVNRGLSALTFLHLTVLLLPTFMTVVLPISLFCGIVYTYNRLNAESELTILRAAGISPFGLARPALILAGIMTLVGYSITLYLMPLGFSSFKDRQYVIRSDFSQILLREGTFTSLSSGLTVYVRARDPSGEVYGILVHDGRNPDAPVTMMAERGALVHSPTGPRLVLFNGNRQEMERAARKMKLLYFDRYDFDLSDLVSKGGPRWREPRERFIGGLFGPPKNKNDEAYRSKLLAEGHQRLVMPLYNIAFAMIALAAMLAGEFRRRGCWRRMLAGSIAAILFQASALILNNMIVKTPALWPLVYLNVVLVTAIAAFILFRMQFIRRAPTPPVLDLRGI